VTGSSVVVGTPISERNVEKIILRAKEEGAAIMVGLRLVYLKDDAL
jgi:hypothetical protein